MSKQPDFIQAFVDWCGEVECPPEYLRWAALSLLGAACGDRITTQRRFGNIYLPIIGNLYIILVGPSANYKSFSMDRIMDILAECDYRESFSLFNGHVTAAGMLDVMNSEHWEKDENGKRHKEDRPWNKHMYLMNDELAACVGAADFADMFVRQLTKMYFGRLFDDVTRTSGRIKLENFTVNWLGSSTAEWLIRSLNPDTMDAGFFRRTIMVNQPYNDKRIWEPKINKFSPSLFKYLCNRTDELLVTHQTLKWTQDARRVAENWYMSQEAPAMENKLGSSSRDQISMILKLALLLSVSRHANYIDDEAMVEAIDLSDLTIKWKQEIMPQMLRGNRGRTEEELLAYIRQYGRVPKHKLSKIAYDKFHMKASELAMLIATWVQADMIEVHELAPNKGGTSYVARSK